MTGAAEVIVPGRAGVFVAEVCVLDAATVTATGRWRERMGPGYRDEHWSEVRSYTWPSRRVEVRWRATS